MKANPNSKPALVTAILLGIVSVAILAPALLGRDGGAVRGQLFFPIPIIPIGQSTSSVKQTAIIPTPDLGACESFPDLFSGDFEDWDDAFESTIQAIIDGNQDEEDIVCTDDLAVLPSERMTGLATTLAKRSPYWQQKVDEGTLTESDVYRMILDYLDAYECALAYEEGNLPEIMVRRETENNEQYSFLNLPEGIGTGQKDIVEQIDIARESVTRTLTILAGLNRLSPLERAFICLERSSRDLRNVLGLAAETSACIPIRTWDTRGQLRDYSYSSASDAPPFIP